MIIGNNNNNNNFGSNNIPPNYNSSFEKRYNTIVEEGRKNQDKINQFQENKELNLYHDATNKNEMADKAYAMLKARLDSGLISLEEFNRKCRDLSKFRQ